MSTQHDGAVRQQDLRDLSHGVSRSLPPLQGDPEGYVVVVEERQAFLEEALSCIATLGQGSVPVAVVGAATPPDASLGLNPALCAGRSTDKEKMAVVAYWIRRGLLGKRITLLTPPHRGVLLNSLLRRQLRHLGVSCETDAMDTPQPHGVDLAQAIVQAGRIMQLMAYGWIDPISDFQPGGRLWALHRRLTC